MNKLVLVQLKMTQAYTFTNVCTFYAENSCVRVGENVYYFDELSPLLVLS